jgi:hypothetical protein
MIGPAGCQSELLGLVPLQRLPARPHGSPALPLRWSGAFSWPTLALSLVDPLVTEAATCASHPPDLGGQQLEKQTTRNSNFEEVHVPDRASKPNAHQPQSDLAILAHRDPLGAGERASVHANPPLIILDLQRLLW